MRDEYHGAHYKLTFLLRIYSYRLKHAQNLPLSTIIENGIAICNWSLLLLLINPDSQSTLPTTSSNNSSYCDSQSVSNLLISSSVKFFVMISASNYNYCGKLLDTVHAQPHLTTLRNSLAGTVWRGGVHNAAASTVEWMDFLTKMFAYELITFILLINYETFSHILVRN